MAKDLRRDDHALAAIVALREPSADDLFRHPFAELPTVDIGRIEEVDTEIECAVHDLIAVGFGGLRAEVHGAEAEPADFQAGTPEMGVVHETILTQLLFTKVFESRTFPL